MARNRHGAALRDIRALFHVGLTGELTDEQLLEEFVASDPEASEMAFSALVARHGPMVLRVCRMILRDSHEAEDAFQATFLVFAQRARSIRKRPSVASWLNGVARRVAGCARVSGARRRIHERRAAEMARPAADTASWDDQVEVLHDEIARLSERYRAVIVLCDLEGLTEGQAAKQLGWPVGTVRSRLRRGRERLRGRLLCRGVTLSALMFGPLSLSEAAPVVVPTALLSSATQVALSFAAGRTLAAGAVPATILALTEKVLRAMFLIKLKISAAALLAVGAAALLATATVGFTQEKPKPKGASPPKARPAAPVASAQSNIILAKLEEPIALVFANPTPLDDVLKYIKVATVAPNFSGIPIYVDPLGLEQAECSLNSTVSMNAENVPLKLTLPRVLAQRRLEFLVEDGVLIISSKERIFVKRSGRVVLAKDDAPGTKALLTRLDEPISMSFANETPLEDVLLYIHQATTTLTLAGIPIYVSPTGLKEAGCSLDSTILIDLEGIPLKTTLRLLLEQLGLDYFVKDGLLLISSPNDMRKIKAATPR